MKTIYKYDLPIEDRIVLELPKGAKLLSVQVQAGKVRLWAMVDPKAKTAKRTLAVYGTGHAIEGEPGVYLASVQTSGGSFVWHFFDLGEQAK